MISGALVRLSAADLIIAPGKRIRAGGSGARLAAGHDAGNQRHQAKNVAAVQRHLEHFARLDDLAKRGVLRLQQRSLGRNFDDLADIADVHRDVDTDRALNFNRDGFAREAAESGLLHLNLVLARDKVDKLIVAAGVGLSSATIGGTEVAQVTFACGTALPDASVTVPTIDP